MVSRKCMHYGLECPARSGRSWAEAIQLLQNDFPEWHNEIDAYFSRWIEMLNGPIEETVDILQHFHHSPNHSIYALTNWSAETFPYAEERYNFLSWFEGIVVSGKEKTRKPFDDIYKIILKRYDLIPETCLFIDDNQDNIEAAERMGIKGIHFKSASSLKDSLSLLGLIN